MDTKAVVKPTKELDGEPAVRTFPTPETNLAKILSDTHYRQEFHARLKTYNPMVVAFYKIGLLPLFGGSRNVMLLTTRGRKSGKLRSTPIGYFRIGGVIHLFSAWGKGTSWFKNMTAAPEDVWIQIGLRRWPVLAQIVDHPSEIQQLIEQFIEESPAQARYLFGWEPGRDRMECANFSQVVEQVLIVRFTEKA